MLFYWNNFCLYEEKSNLSILWKQGTMSLRTRQQQGQRRRRRRSCKLATANKEKGKTSIFVLGVKALNLHCQKVVVMIKQGPEKQKGELSKPSFTNLPTISICQNTYNINLQTDIFLQQIFVLSLRPCFSANGTVNGLLYNKWLQ